MKLERAFNCPIGKKEEREIARAHSEKNPKRRSRWELKRWEKDTLPSRKTNPKKRFDQTGEVGEAFPGERVLSPIGLWELAYGGFDTTWEKSTVILAQAALYIVSLIAGRKREFFFDYVIHTQFVCSTLHPLHLLTFLTITSNKLHERKVWIRKSLSFLLCRLI